MEGLLASADWDVLSSYAGLLGLACFSIYCGSYGSLSEVCSMLQNGRILLLNGVSEKEIRQEEG
jgi:hypothetical protein